MQPAASTSGRSSFHVRVPLRLRVTGSASGRPDICIDLLQLSAGAAAEQPAAAARGQGVAGTARRHKKGWQECV